MGITVYPKIVSKEDFIKWKKGKKIWSCIGNKLIDIEEFLNIKKDEEIFDNEMYEIFDDFFKENEYEENNWFYEYLTTPKGEEVVVFGKVDIDTFF